MDENKKTVFLINEKSEKKLSKEQKKFNDLITKIEQEKEVLKTWHQTVEACKDKYFAEFVPVLKKYKDQQMNMILKLDQALTKHQFIKKERKVLSEMILSLIQNVLKELEDPENLKTMRDLEIKYQELCAQYRTKAEQRRFEQMEIEAEALKDLFSSNGSDEASFEPDFEQDFNQGFERDKAENFEHKFEEDKKKSKKQIQKEQQETEASRAVKDIFRKLAKELHPDREQDPIEKDRKHELMQRANEAYEKKDLLGLLGLQLEIEQINSASIDSVAEDQLKHYNRVLKEQLEELEMEVEDLKYSLQAFGLLVPEGSRNKQGAPEVLLKNLDRDIKELKKLIRGMKQDIESFDAPENIKMMLMACEARALERDLEDEFGAEW